MIVRSVVVLPAPFRPTRQTTSRAPTASELPRRDAAPRAEAEQLRDLERLRVHVAVARERREEPRAAPEPRDDRGLERLEHGELGEDLHELEGSGHAEPRQARRADAAHVAAPEAHAARARAEDTGEDVDEGGLARAVRPDDRDEFAGADAEAHPVERAELAVELPEPLGAEDHAPDRRPGRRRRAASPMSPPGAKMTRAARIAPKTSRQ